MQTWREVSPILNQTNQYMYLSWSEIYIYIYNSFKKTAEEAFEQVQREKLELELEGKLEGWGYGMEA